MLVTGVFGDNIWMLTDSFCLQHHLFFESHFRLNWEQTMNLKKVVPGLDANIFNYSLLDTFLCH